MSEKEEQIKSAEKKAGIVAAVSAADIVHPDKRVLQARDWALGSHRTGDLRRDVMEGATHVSYLLYVIERMGREKQ